MTVPAVRHLRSTNVADRLAAGKGIEQLLPTQVADPPTVRWITVWPTDDGLIAVSLHEVLDVGTGEFQDVTEFPSLDATEDHGEGREVGVYSSIPEALEAARDVGATVDRWVNEGMIGQEYRDTRALG